MDENDFYHKIERDGTERYALVITPTEAIVYDTDGNAQELDLPTYLVTTNPKRDLRAVTIADNTFIVNRAKTVALTANTTAERDPEAIVVINKVNRGADYTISFFTSTGASSPAFTNTVSSIDTNPDRDPASGDPVCENQGDVMALLMQPFTAPSAFSAVFSHFYDGPHLWVSKQDGTDFRIEVTCTVDGGMSVFKNDVQNFAALPKRGWDGFKIKVRGDPETDSDDYWVEFKGTSGQTAWCDGYWEESIAPDITYELDAATLPVVLQSTASGVANFSFAAYTWQDRLVGDDDSNPAPSFVGATIENVAWHRSRLVLVSGENSILSEAGAPGNFWRTSVVDILDSDPIDVSNPHTKVSRISAAVPYDRNLLLLAEAAQLKLTSADILTGNTAKVDRASDYSYDSDIQPITLGRSVFFPFYRGGGYSGLYEYRPSSQDAEQFVANDVTEHCPKYLPKLRAIAGLDTERILFALPATETDAVYVYQWFDSNEGRVQGAWHKWTFGADVWDVWVINQEVFFLIDRNGSACLEKLTLSDFDTTRLDLRVTQDDCTVVLVGATTYVTLPNGPSASVLVPEGTTLTLLTEDGDLFEEDTNADGTIAISGEDLTTTNFVIGLQYESRLDLTRPLMRQRDETKAMIGDFIVKYGVLQYDQTAGFHILVTAPSRTTKTLTWGPQVVGGSDLGTAVEPETATWRFPVMLKSEGLEISLVNDTPFISGWLSLEWEGAFHRRSK